MGHQLNLGGLAPLLCPLSPCNSQELFSGASQLPHPKTQNHGADPKAGERTPQSRVLPNLAKEKLVGATAWGLRRPEFKTCPQRPWASHPHRNKDHEGLSQMTGPAPGLTGAAGTQ